MANQIALMLQCAHGIVSKSNLVVPPSPFHGAHLASRELQFRGYIPGLDVLRGIAIALVLLYHGIAGRTQWDAWHGLSRGVVYFSFLGLTGVNLFFVLSGFLITGILVDTAASPRYYQDFYRNRVFRILPAYVLMLVVLLFTHTINGYFVLAAMLFIANMASLVGAHSTQYPSLWSLAVEEQFYLLWPTLIHRCSLRILVRGVVAYLVLSPCVRMAVTHYRPHVDMLYKLWGNADLLLAGALVAITLRTGGLHRDNILKWLVGLAAVFAVTAPVVFYRDLHHYSNYQTNPFYRVPFLLLYTGLLLLVVIQNRGPKREFRTRHSFAPHHLLLRGLTFLGYISYGLYLVHSLVFQKFDEAVAGTWLASTTSLAPILVSFLLGTALSIAIAWLSRSYFENFFLRLKKKPHAPV